MGRYGSAVEVSGGTVEVRNSIIWELDVDYRGPDTAFSNIARGNTNGTGTISADPLFVRGPLGGLYLSQVQARQPSDSPSLDTGGDPATALGLDSYTTRIDEIADAGTVDMGYHYPIPLTPRERRIFVSQAADTAVTYPPVPGTVYDLIRGRVSSLRDGGLFVDLGAVDCVLENDGSGLITDLLAPVNPGPGEIFFYLLGDDSLPGPYGSSSQDKERVPLGGDCT